MSRLPVALVAVALVAAAISAGSALAHEGHGATPAHLHPTGGFPVDIGAIVIVGVVGFVALAVAVARRRG